MKNMVKAAVALVAAFASAASFAAAAKGSCVSKAISLKASQTAKLVAEYDSEEKETYDNGVAYYSVTLKRGQAYTIWITGGNVADIDLDVNTNWEYYDKASNEDKEPSADFTVEEVTGGSVKVAYLYADDWDLEADGDPKSGKYIVTLEGDIGKTTTLNYAAGIRTFTVTGTEESPKVLSMADKWKSVSAKLIEGDYFFRASLKAGRKYRVRTSGGTKTSQLTLDVDDGSGSDGDEGEEESDDYPDPAYASDTNNTALIVVPSTSGKYVFNVGNTSESDTQSFKFYYMAVPQRAISAHPSIPLIADNGYSATFRPGRITNSDSYYDSIVDEHLFKITLAKGERWIFETSGATKEQEMIVYNKNGTILQRNSVLGDGTLDSRIVVNATYTGLYYVGVYDPSLDVYDTPDAGSVTLTARNAADLDAPDEFDPADNVYAGATLLNAYPVATNQTSVSAAVLADQATAEKIGAISGVHRLGANDFYDCFAVPCRKGCTYNLRAIFADSGEIATNNTLSATVVYYSSGKAKTLASTGDISGESAVNEMNDDFSFTAKVSGIHYVRVSVGTGLGLDYPAYRLAATVMNGESTFKLLRVDLDGGVGTWYLGSETAATYPSGTVLAVPNSASVSVNFAKATGLVAPAAKTVSLPAWTAGSDPVSVTARFTDAYETKYVMSTKKVGTKTTYVYSPATGDNTVAGAFPLTPAAAEKSAVRTLWANDAQDLFSVTATAATYYTFRIESTNPNLTLTAVNSTTGATAAGVPTADGKGIEIVDFLPGAGKTVLTVAHGTGSDKNSAYTLKYSKVTAGIAKFTKTAYSVKEGTEYATLQLVRTGTEGTVRVKYATQAGTARPGEQYYPVDDGVVTWAPGDKAAKTVKIRLIPDLNAHWAASNLTFQVRLYTFDESDRAAGEYIPVLNSMGKTTVTITEATAKKPGTISLASWGTGDDETAVSNVKKPVVTAKAGESVVLNFTRTGGTSGRTQVKVSAAGKTLTDTAKAGTDYVAKTQTLTWADGDAEPKQFVLDLKSSGLVASKKLTLTIAAVKSGFTPTLSAKTATVTVKNATVDQTAAAYVKSLAKTGLSVASTGTWFKDYDGNLRSSTSNGTLTFTVTGPGVFYAKPALAKSADTDAGKLTCQFDKEAAIDCTADSFPGAVGKVFASGKHTVKFTLSGVSGHSYAAFENGEDGSPFVWTQLSKVAASEPANKAYVESGAVKSLSWTMSGELAAIPGLFCRVRYGTNQKALSVLATDAERKFSVALSDAPDAAKAYYWTVDYGYSEDSSAEALAALKWTAGTAWTFTTVATGAPKTSIPSSAANVDAAGVRAADRIAGGEPVELIQGVKPTIRLGSGDGSANFYRLVAGTLPKGVTVNATTGALSGVPTAAGTYNALLQSAVRTAKTVTKTVNGVKKKVTTYTYVYGTTIPVEFSVLPAGTSVGTFRAALADVNGDFPAVDARHQGSLALTVTSAGKMTASVVVGGVTYKFTGTGYDEIVERTGASEGVTHRLRARLTNTTLINKKTKSVNYLTIDVDEGCATNGVALATASGSVELDLNVANTALTSVTKKNVVYGGTLRRSTGASAYGAAAVTPFAGYYTVALAPKDVDSSDGVPVGNGYLLATVAANGTVKVTGVLADGTAYSATSVGQIVGKTAEDPKSCSFVFPVFAGKTTVYSLAGEVEIAYEDASSDDAIPVAVPSSTLLWCKTKSAATSRDGTGFGIETAPTGGWYDKVVNLQAYYRDREYAVAGFDGGDDLPSETLAKGYVYTAQSTPHDLSVRLSGNTLAVDSRKLVKNATLGVYDFADGVTSASVNPWAVTFKFTRATGVITGTLSAWQWYYPTVNGYTWEYPSKQTEIKKLAHKGVFLFTRDGSSDSPLEANAQTAGFFLMPATKKWTASLPFDIVATEDTETTYDEHEF